MTLFSLKSYLYRIFKLKFEISALKLTHVPNFSKIEQKIKELEFRPRPILHDDIIRQNNDVVKIFVSLRDFVSEYHRARFGGNWTTNKGETCGALCSPTWLKVSKAVKSCATYYYRLTSLKSVCAAERSTDLILAKIWNGCIQ